MKRINISLLCIVLTLTSTSHAMEWARNWMSNEQAKETDSNNIDNIIEIFSSKDFERAYSLACIAQDCASEIKQDILRYFIDHPASLTNPTENKEATEKLKDQSVHGLSGNDALNELPKHILKGAHINEPVIHLKSFLAKVFASVGVIFGATVSAAGAVVIPTEAPFSLILKIIPQIIVLTGFAVTPPAMGYYSTNNHYATLLNKAINDDDRKLVEYLLAHGADVNQVIYDSVEKEKTHLFFSTTIPLAKALEKHDGGMIQRFLSYDAIIDSALFSKEIIDTPGAFHLLLTTFLYRQAKNNDALQQKSFCDVATEFASLINKLKKEEKAVFMYELRKSGQDIIAYFEKMINYYKGVKTVFGIDSDDLQDEEGTKKNQGIFVFDSKDANRVLSLLFHIIDLNLIKSTQYQNRLEVCIEYLLEQGAYINIYFSHMGLYITPLHRAIIEGNNRCVEYLLRHKANPNMPTSEGKRPLQIAIDRNDRTIALLLMNNQQEKVDIKLIMQESNGFLNKLAQVIGKDTLNSVFTPIVLTAALAAQKIPS